MGISRIIIVGTLFAAMNETLQELLPASHIQVVEPEQLYKERFQAEVFIPKLVRVDGAMMDRFDGLRLIQQFGAGVEGIDIAAATQRGIAVANVPTAGTGNAESVAEWCIMAAIAISRRLPALTRTVQSGSTWGSPMGQALLGKTAGIIGLGGIGQALAARLKPFGMRLIGIKQSPDPLLAERLGLDWLGGMDDMETLLQQSDYIFLCVPLTEQTRGLINEKNITSLQKNASIINAGRGGLLSEKALAQALSEERLLGAGLDVFEQEPLDPHSPLLRSQNIIATPHIGGITDVAMRGTGQVVVENIHRLESGQPLKNCINGAELHKHTHASALSL